MARASALPTSVNPECLFFYAVTFGDGGLGTLGCLERPLFGLEGPTSSRPERGARDRLDWLEQLGD